MRSSGEYSIDRPCLPKNLGEFLQIWLLSPITLVTVCELMKMQGYIMIIRRVILGMMLLVGFTGTAWSENEFIYLLNVQTDSNITSIEIRDDAEFVIAPDNAPFNMTSKKGAKNFVVSQKKVVFEQLTRGEAEFDLYVQSKNQVLGLTICKGSRLSYTVVQTEEGKHKNDVDEQDYCEKAALVLQLH